jgi:hypothetical protein
MMNQTVVNVEIVECPICMDEINGEKNKVTTECGHCFHTSCLMKNVAHNGFGCPYCRDAMAEEPADNNSDEEYDEFSIEEEEGTDYSDNVLRGARWLFQRAEGEEVDDDQDSVLDEEEENDEPVDRPSVDYIVEKLVQRGVTMADIVKSILLVDHPEYQDEESFEREDNELFGKLRIIISNYQPPAVVAPLAVEEESTHHQSSRLRSHDSAELEEAVETVVSVHEAMSLVHRGPIRKGVTVDKNDPNYERFSQYCDAFYSSERASRYERMAAIVVQEEEASVKLPFPFQIKGSCVPNEVA